MDLKTEAEIMRICLELELISKSEVISWADNVVAKTDQPDLAVIEVSLAKNHYINDILKVLEDVGGTIDLARLYQEVFALMKTKLQPDPDSETLIARALFRMAINGDVPDKSAAEEMYRFYDDLDLARYGYYKNRTVEDVRKQLRSFLNRYSNNQTAEG